MISGPVMVQVLEGENADRCATASSWEPPIRSKADKGTIRADFADSIDANAVHGSDAPGHGRRRDRLLLPGMNRTAA
jgi:nucleoside-diphosphate kinase